MSIEDQIKKAAQTLGFDQAGITSLGSLAEGEERIREWVAEGRHGTMKYLENFSARSKKFLEGIPDAKSVIVLGVNYYSENAAKNSGLSSPAISGRIARYAQGRDYHREIANRHAELIEALRKFAGGGFSAKSCVDIQPVPERFAAGRAGLGFIGKHTGILSAQFGPWLFLSEIITNLELKEDLPAEGDCGTCAHCQRVCPTGALERDYNIDARLCISYLTIEHKGIIPRELRPQMKDWIFGCDECMDICPFGSKSKETSWQALKPEAGAGRWIDIENLFKLSSNSEYEKKFAGTALLRAGRKQMLRNACIVLGNSHSADALPLLAQALKHEAPLVRLHAAWGIGQIESAESRRLLDSARESETDSEVMSEIRNALNLLRS